MDIDDEDPLRKHKDTNRDREPAIKEPTTKTKALPFWEELRKGADVAGINDKLLETVIPSITLKELLSISPDLISHWFGVKRVPAIGGGPGSGIKENDLKEAFEVSATKWISK